MPDQHPPATGFADRQRPGVCVAPSHSFANCLLAEAAANGLTAARIDLSQAATKEAFLAECARRLDFPPYFGHNWDAFDE
ncbi:MAG TPA: barstar family protein, partial [Thermomicrobiales bacterium]|nr:barstar family protein [Thermomicrobiales bacterium]